MTHYSATSLEQIADELERLAAEATDDEPLVATGLAIGFFEAATLVRNTRLADPAMEAMVKALEKAKRLIGAGNGDHPDPAIRESNVNQAWHVLDAALAKDNGHV